MLSDMKQWRGFGLLLLTLLVPLFTSGQVFAATLSSTQELHVTATIPSHRDIIIDSKGQIVSITSNTPEDVQPDVYLLSPEPNNQKPLTDTLYKQYRKYVPEGTAKYGVLYQRSVLATLLKPQLSVNS
jgi:hypothetical protein